MIKKFFCPLDSKKIPPLTDQLWLTLSTRISYFTRFCIIVLVTPWKSKQLSWNKFEVISCYLRVNDHHCHMVTHPSCISRQQNLARCLTEDFICLQSALHWKVHHHIQVIWFPPCCVQATQSPDTPCLETPVSFLAMEYAIMLLIRSSF